VAEVEWLPEDEPKWLIYLPASEERDFDLYWTGSNWSRQERDASVYDSFEEAFRVFDLELGQQGEIDQVD
jgi:hypothetical protein